MNDEAVRAKLSDALIVGVGSQVPRGLVWNLDTATAALLPVVREIAAEELREAARMLNLTHRGVYTSYYFDWIIARADALTKPPDGPVR